MRKSISIIKCGNCPSHSAGMYGLSPNSICSTLQIDIGSCEDYESFINAPPSLFVSVEPFLPSVQHLSLQFDQTAPLPFISLHFPPSTPQLPAINRGYDHYNNDFLSEARVLIKQYQLRDELRRFKEGVGCVGRQICIKGYAPHFHY